MPWSCRHPSPRGPGNRSRLVARGGKPDSAPELNQDLTRAAALVLRYASKAVRAQGQAVVLATRSDQQTLELLASPPCL
ncbi:MAG: hypothetical protein EYX74_07480 [Desulfobulbaceae bacterium]|nr:MAG: hypothetical protein EYX74_07480 [Desulfobulbaceae bacterium]